MADLFSPQDCLAFWIANKPVRHGKKLWLSIYKCIECAVEQDEIARKLSNIKTDIEKHDEEITKKYIDEIKALRWLFDCAVDCDFGLDNFPEEYEKYKDCIDDEMTYREMMLTIARRVVAEEKRGGAE